MWVQEEGTDIGGNGLFLYPSKMFLGGSVGGSASVDVVPGGHYQVD